MVSWLTLLGQCITCYSVLVHPARGVHHLPLFSGPHCWVSAPLAIVVWPTQPGVCTTCHSFLAHPAWQVHHLWFSGPSYQAGAPLAMVFTWPTLPCRCTTCRGFLLGPPCLAGASLASVRTSAPLAMAFFFVLFFVFCLFVCMFLGPPCRASALFAVVFTWPGWCTICCGFYLAGPAYHLPWFLLGPPCWGSALFATVFLAHPAGKPTCHGFLGPTGPVYHLLGFSGRPCRARAPIAVELGAL